MIAEVKTVMLQLDASDAHILDQIVRHTRLPMAHVLRMSLRHYALCGEWPIGCPGLREQVLDAARKLNQAKRQEVR